MIGETIGKYRIVARLGRGGIGTVYQAVDQTLEREVAIKVINPGLTESDLLKRFRAEAITLARLNHPNIATLYELGQHGDELLMVMEFVRGETFDKLSERVGPMPFERAAQLIAQVLDALGHAHHVGIVHRDIKPANLILSESGVVKVMDFGIARMVGTEHLTDDGTMMGNPAYMAPEQVMGNEVDGRADLYSVGVILFRMLTGHLPFKADTVIALVEKQVKDPPTPLRQYRAELPAWCEQILDRALAKPPEARYQTADDFRSALMLSAALAPATEVTSVLAAGGVTTDSVKAAGPGEVPSAFPPGPAPPSPRAPVATAAPVFIPIAPPPSAPAFVAANPPAPPRPQRAAGQARATNNAGVVLAVAVAAVVVAAALFVTLRQPSPSDPIVTAAPSASPPPAVTPEAAPPAAAALPPAVTTSAPAAAPAPRVQAPASAAAAARGRPDVRVSAERESSPAPVARPSAPESKPIFPSMTFAPVRLVVLAGTRTSEQETSLQLTRDALELPEKDGSGAIKSIPYSSVIAIFLSRSRDPQWIGPSGVVLPIVKMDGGMFGFMKGDRDWVSVRTKAEFVMLRPDGPLVARVIDAIEARTGLTTIRVGKRDAGKD